MKDPAFLFYTSDFLTGITDLTMEERGQFITLLCLQHQKGHLSDKMIGISVGNAAADVMAKFRQDPAGLWYNARLDKEIAARLAHSDKQKQRALSGWEKRKKEVTTVNAMGDAAALPIYEDENEIVNEDRNKGKEGVGEKPLKPKTIPSFEEFLNHAISKEPLLDEGAVKLKYDAWLENGWKNGLNKPITNWKANLNNTIPHIKKKTENATSEKTQPVFGRQTQQTINNNILKFYGDGG